MFGKSLVADAAGRGSGGKKNAKQASDRGFNAILREGLQQPGGASPRSRHKASPWSRQQRQASPRGAIRQPPVATEGASVLSSLTPRRDSTEVLKMTARGKLVRSASTVELEAQNQKAGGPSWQRRRSTCGDTMAQARRDSFSQLLENAGGGGTLPHRGYPKPSAPDQRIRSENDIFAILKPSGRSPRIDDLQDTRTFVERMGRSGSKSPPRCSPRRRSAEPGVAPPGVDRLACEEFRNTMLDILGPSPDPGDHCRLKEVTPKERRMISTVVSL